jgi:ABC-type polysaccharide/polyol phosphate transport system ATPase subunit
MRFKIESDDSMAMFAGIASCNGAGKSTSLKLCPPYSPQKRCHASAETVSTETNWTAEKHTLNGSIIGQWRKSTQNQIMAFSGLEDFRYTGQTLLFVAVQRFNFAEASS